MSLTKRRIMAAVLLVLLIGVPFWDWKVGAVLWMCAWLIFIFQNLYSGHTWKFGAKDDRDEDEPS